MGNTDLKKAKRGKKDEFYTQISDIEKELINYKKDFKNKVIFCNCDDPEESNFWRYFFLNFKHLGLKRLVATHYEEEQPSYKLEYDGIDIKKTSLRQNGDFRSLECIEILKSSDLVVTNPPFSLFREYISQLVDYDKDFIIIGNTNAITYKETFKLLKENKFRIGYTNFNVGMFFIVPDYYEKYTKIEDGVKYARVSTSCWFTSLETTKMHEEMILYEEYNEEKYPTYENYDAINVDRVKEIPKDYYGTIGVPITFMNKHNPDQFQIEGLGIVGSCDFTKNDKMEILDKTGTPIGKFTRNAKGTLYRKYNPLTDKRAAFKNVDTGDLYSSIYARVLIKRKER